MNFGNLPLYLMFFLPIVAVIEIVLVAIKLLGWVNVGWLWIVSPLILYAILAIVIFGWLFLKSSGYWSN